MDSEHRISPFPTARGPCQGRFPRSVVQPHSEGSAGPVSCFSLLGLVPVVTDPVCRPGPRDVSSLCDRPLAGGADRVMAWARRPRPARSPYPPAGPTSMLSGVPSTGTSLTQQPKERRMKSRSRPPPGAQTSRGRWAVSSHDPGRGSGPSDWPVSPGRPQHSHDEVNSIHVILRTLSSGGEGWGPAEHQTAPERRHVRSHDERSRTWCQSHGQIPRLGSKPRVPVTGQDAAALRPQWLHSTQTQEQGGGRWRDSGYLGVEVTGHPWAWGSTRAVPQFTPIT